VEILKSRIHALINSKAHALILGLPVLKHALENIRVTSTKATKTCNFIDLLA